MKLIKEAYKEFRGILLLSGFTSVEDDLNNFRAWKDWSPYKGINELFKHKDGYTLMVVVSKNYVVMNDNSKYHHYYVGSHSSDKASIAGSIRTMIEEYIGWGEEEVASTPVSEDYSLETVTVPAGDGIQSFEMCTTPITWSDWEKYIEANPDENIPNNDSGFGRGDRPVINVSYNDVQKYIKWLNEVTGETYALPTSEQWEHAARGGVDTTFYTGDSINVGLSNFYSSAHNHGKTLPVKAYPPNQYGLYGMLGNAWELTE
jgi:hypothetical protein